MPLCVKLLRMRAVMNTYKIIIKSQQVDSHRRQSLSALVEFLFCSCLSFSQTVIQNDIDTLCYAGLHTSGSYTYDHLCQYLFYRIYIMVFGPAILPTPIVSLTQPFYGLKPSRYAIYSLYFCLRACIYGRNQHNSSISISTNFWAFPNAK